MNLKFTKMHGCGNDYIYFNCFTQQIDDPCALSEKLSDRHFGVGGDGIVMICPSQVADAKMRMFNADGSEGKMCGNAIRCVAKYLYDNKMVESKSISIETLSGIKYIDINVCDSKAVSATVNMGKAILTPSEIPVTLKGEKIIGKTISVEGKDYDITCVSMGNPHCIIFGDDPANVDLYKIGPVFENLEIFPERVNTEFVQFIDKNTLKMRVWERGSGETLACGTGACATVVAACENGFCNKGEDITVKLVGGELVINYTDERVMMTGPATAVFDGELAY